MPDVKKAHCPAPSAVVGACRKHFAEARPQSPARAGANLIAEGVGLIAEARQDAPKLVALCRQRYPHFGAGISTHVPAAVREQARQLRRARAFASLQEIYLEAILRSLVKRGLMSADLEVPR
jgi:hypothetical protein